MLPAGSSPAHIGRISPRWSGSVAAPAPASGGAPARHRSADASRRAGFVVPAKVGNSVVRHRVTRRLRPLVRQQLASLPSGTDVVVRALPSAATATSAELGPDLRSGLAWR